MTRVLRVTAIVPTCQRPMLLERALRSIAAQEVAPLEVVVVNDGPAADEPAVRTAMARRELLAFLDDDDYAALRERLVRHYHHGGPRICTPQGDAVRSGMGRFFALHAHRMTPAQRDEFGHAVRRLWGIDEHGRLV